MESFPSDDRQDDAASLPDRRDGDRYVSVLKICRAVIGDRDQLCMVRNISNKGMKIDLPGRATPDERVTIELRSDRILHGTIRWSQGQACGIELDDEVNLADVLDNKPPSTLLRQRPRSPRFEREAALTAEHNGNLVEGTLFDISLQGVGIEALTPCRIGDRMVVTIAGLSARSAVVRWVRGKRIGLLFERPLPFTELALWLDSHHGA